MTPDDKIFEQKIKLGIIKRIESEIGFTDDPNLLQLLGDGSIKIPH
jgi:hypothetical protein